MRSRTDLYRANAEACRHEADLPQNVPQRDRWLKLDDQWSKMAEEAKKDRRRVHATSRLAPSRLRDIPPLQI
jgi:hypothetical protein